MNNFKLILTNSNLPGFPRNFVCKLCGRRYQNCKSLWAHEKYVCGKAPSFKCPMCDYYAWHKHHMKNHLFRHNIILNETNIDRFLY